MGDYDSHISRGHPVLFGLLALFAFIEGCITAWLVSQFNNNSYPDASIRDRLRFLVFVSWWTFFFCGVFIVAFFWAAMSIISSIASHAVWIILTWILWLGGIASYTAALGGGQRCGHSLLIHCSQLVAAEAFGWLSWILITIMMIFILAVGGNALRRGERLSAGLTDA